MRSSKKKINGFLILLASIVGVGVIMYVTNLDRGPSLLEQKQLQQQAGSDSKDIASQTAPDLQETTSPTPTNTPLPSVEGISTRKIFIMIDANANGIVDIGEKGCDVCSAKTLVLGNIATDGTFPSPAKLSTTDVKSNGTVDESAILSANSLWGAFDDRKILIPQQSVSLGDSGSDAYVLARQISLSVAGINSGLGKIAANPVTVKGKYSVIYQFDQLVPAMAAAFDNGKDIWVQFTPNSAAADKYYLMKALLQKDSSGSVTGSVDKYYLQIDWPFSAAMPEALDANNLHFILL